jgi:dolichyl-phosphate beta-glucosyltransferase
MTDQQDNPSRSCLGVPANAPSHPGPPEPVTLSIIIPCYQEGHRIINSIRTICAEMVRRSVQGWEVIVVDDGSSDDTARRVDGTHPRVRVIRMPVNRGKGAAVRTGMLAARGRLRLMTDADLSTPIAEVGRLIEAVNNGADIVIGRRTGPRSRVRRHQPWYRELMGKIFNLFIRLMFNVRYEDTQCGFKLFTDRAAWEIFRRAKVDRFAFDFECLLLARELRLKVSECYVLWDHVEPSSVRVFTDSAGMLVTLVRLRLGLL